MKKKVLVLHPFLFSVFPIFFVWAFNKEQIFVDKIFMEDILFQLFRHSLIASIVLVILNFFTKDFLKAGLLTSFSLIAYFSCGHLISGITSIAIFLLEDHVVYFCLYLSTYLLIFVKINKIKNHLPEITHILNFVSICLIVLNFAIICPFRVSEHIKDEHALNLTKFYLENSINPESKPDIYYIILDRYANEHTLANFYGFDNGDFLSFLREKGFYIASKSCANYHRTGHSLASSLNMEYIDYLSDRVGKVKAQWSEISFGAKRRPKTWAPIYLKLHDYTVWRFLKAKGYQFIHVGSGWKPTNINHFADFNINLTGTTELQALIASKTFLRFFNVTGASLKLWPLQDVTRREKYERIKYQLSELEKLARGKAPKFVFAHFLVPHDPYIFDRNGEFLSKRVNRWDDHQKRKLYIDQLIFINKAMERLITKIIEDSESAPIIILQSDEGPFPQKIFKEIVLKHNSYDWSQATDEELNEKMPILNAYYLPGTNYQKTLYPEITPVNSFRLVFNNYFGTNLEYLPDKVYISKDSDHIYDFIDVTERIKFNDTERGMVMPRHHN